MGFSDDKKKKFFKRDEKFKSAIKSVHEDTELGEAFDVGHKEDSRTFDTDVD